MRRLSLPEPQVRRQAVIVSLSLTAESFQIFFRRKTNLLSNEKIVDRDNGARIF